MKRLFRVVLASIAISALLCGVVVIIGRAQPADPPLPELTRCGETMCVYGITPDKTEWSDAQAILRRTKDFSFSVPGNYSLFKQSYPFYRLDVIEVSGHTGVFSESAPINEIDFYFYDFFKYPGPTAAEMLTKLGPPCGLSIESPGQIFLIYPSMLLFFIYSGNQIPAQRFNPDLRLIELKVANNIGACSVAFDEDSGIQPWRGFANYSTQLQ